MRYIGVKPKKFFSIPIVSGKPAAAGPPVFTFRGVDNTNTGASAFTSTTINIGTATADRFVIVGTLDQNAVGVSGITVNGVSLVPDTQRFTAGNPGAYIYSGLVGTTGGTGVATIVVNYVGSSAFTERTMIVWTGTGLSHTAGAATTVTGSPSNTLNISVQAGDFMIVATPFGYTYGGSTQAPTTIRSEPSSTSVYTQFGPEWNTITSTNASFAITVNVGGLGLCAATYH